MNNICIGHADIRIASELSTPNSHPTGRCRLQSINIYLVGSSVKVKLKTVILQKQIDQLCKTVSQN